MSKVPFDLTDEQKKILECAEYQLILGGPGSGKTTISIIKAAQIAKKQLGNHQQVLFLSFARATVSRVIDAINEHSFINNEIKRKITVDTYHAFFWKIISTHGYLLGLPKKLSILLPANEAIVLSNIRKNYGKEKDLSDVQKKEKKEKERETIVQLAFEEGKISFNLFAEYTHSLLSRSNKLLKLISSTYPVIILDEFQDTSFEQWGVVKCLGSKSKLIALADPEQRIFDFIGADPERLNHFRNIFSPKEYDLKSENHRSNGTEILAFGNDIIKGQFQKNYSGVSFFTFPSNSNQAFSELKVQTLKVRKRLIASGKDGWTLAILVPTKKLMRQVSDNFNHKSSKLPEIHHSASIDMHGAVLAAEIIAFLLQPISIKDDDTIFIELLCNFFYGKGGDSPTKSDIYEAESIMKAFSKVVGYNFSNKKISKSSIIHSILATYNLLRNLHFSGDPYNDWLLVRNTLEKANCKRLNQVAYEAKNIRLLNRGTQLRDALSQNWRENGKYSNALNIVRQSFLIEHFATSLRPEKGVVIMNMHKAKGKQFDEVIIFEGWPQRVKGKIVSNPDRIVIGNMRNNDLTHFKQNFRVSITRSKLHTTILTPADDICILLIDS